MIVYAIKWRDDQREDAFSPFDCPTGANISKKRAWRNWKRPEGKRGNPPVIGCFCYQEFMKIGFKITEMKLNPNQGDVQPCA